MSELLVKFLNSNAKVPMRVTSGSAGYDLYSTETLTLLPGERKLVGTGLSIKLPEGTYGRIAPRSGMAVKYIDVCAGVIDSDFRNQVKVLLQNAHTQNSYEINCGDRIAQLILESIVTPEVREVEELDQTERGMGGFGSTGR